jgi:hypothetical protein
MEKIVGHDKNDLIKGINEVIEKIKEKTEQTYISNGEEKPVYELKGNLEHLKMFDIHKYLMNDMGICDRRRLRKLINKCLVKDGLRVYNNFLHFFNKRLRPDENIRLVCPKHDEIQLIKKKWKNLQKQAEQALKEYKDCKGDFYKQLEVVKEKEIA